MDFTASSPVLLWEYWSQYPLRTARNNAVSPSSSRSSKLSFVTFATHFCLFGVSECRVFGWIYMTVLLPYSKIMELLKTDSPNQFMVLIRWRSDVVWDQSVRPFLPKTLVPPFRFCVCLDQCFLDETIEYSSRTVQVWRVNQVRNTTHQHQLRLP